METLIPEISDYELERGKPMPSFKHALIQRKIILLLSANSASEYIALPEINLALNSGKAVPDIGIFLNASLDYSVEQISLTVMPVTAIEILSPTQAIAELLEKAARYFASGVKSYWLIVPELRAVAVFYEPKKYKYLLQRAKPARTR